jgi:glyoxylase-like metal-dependent hydrolase (beta-lactamase superfamily II)
LIFARKDKTLKRFAFAHIFCRSKKIICLLTEGGETLIAGDLLSNSLYLGLTVCYENMEGCLNSIQKTLYYEFTKIAFGHGRTILKGAASVIRGTFDPYSFA